MAGTTAAFGTKSDRDLKELAPILKEILSHESYFHNLSDNDLRQKTLEFKSAINLIIKDFNKISKKYDAVQRCSSEGYKCEKIAIEKKPKLIIAGGSAYSRIIDFKKFKEIATRLEIAKKKNKNIK